MKARRSGGRTQKQVDVRLAVDLLSMTLAGRVRRCELIAGDLDFEPLVRKVVEAGAWVSIWYDPSSYAPDLLDAADSRELIDVNRLVQWAVLPNGNKPQLPWTSSTESIGALSALVIGRSKEAEIEVYAHPTERSFVGRRREREGAWEPVLVHSELEVLKGYLSLGVGDWRWCDPPAE